MRDVHAVTSEARFLRFPYHRAVAQQSYLLEIERTGEFEDAQHVQIIAVVKPVHPARNMPLLPELGNNYCPVSTTMCADKGVGMKVVLSHFRFAIDDIRAVRKTAVDA